MAPLPCRVIYIEGLRTDKRKKFVQRQERFILCIRTSDFVEIAGNQVLPHKNVPFAWLPSHRHLQDGMETAEHQGIGNCEHSARCRSGSEQSHFHNCAYGISHNPSLAAFEMAALKNISNERGRYS